MKPCKTPQDCGHVALRPEDYIFCNPHSCDVCGETVARSQLANCIAYGIETAACENCRNNR